MASETKKAVVGDVEGALSLLSQGRSCFCSRAAEADVGITEYVNRDTLPFIGILKQRYEDFIVSEIDKQGNIVRLSDETHVPPTPAAAAGVPNDEEIGSLLAEYPATESLPPALASSCNAIQDQNFVQIGGEQTSELGKFLAYLSHVRAVDSQQQQQQQQPTSGQQTVNPGTSSVVNHPSIGSVGDGAGEVPSATGAGAGAGAGTDNGSDKPLKTMDASSRQRPVSKVADDNDKSKSRKRKRQPDPITFAFAPRSSKEARTALHQMLRRLLLFESKTDASGAILAEYRPPKAGSRRRQSSEWPWPKPQQYLEFVMLKENRDTMDVVISLSRSLHVNSSLFSWAGTKDKRAVTQQKMTAFKLRAERLLSQVNNNNPFLRNVRLGNFRIVSERLFLGDHSGNHFTVTLRDLQCDQAAATGLRVEEALEKAAAAVGRHGFINYFGLQRFGHGGFGTQAVGRLLLRREWHKAVQVLLIPGEDEHESIAEVKLQFLKTGDAITAFDQLSSRATLEKSLLKAIAKQQKNKSSNTTNTTITTTTTADSTVTPSDGVVLCDDPLAALNAIPRNMRSMYVHAWQSWAFNLAASERVRRYGTDAPVVGDLVLDSDSATADDDGGDSPGVPEPIPVSQPGKKHRNASQSPDPVVVPSRRSSARPLTQEDIDSGRWTIADVVLPLPGHAVRLPANDIADIYLDFLCQQEVEQSQLSNRQNREYDLAGDYRLLIQRPGDYKWTLLRYNDPNVPLAHPTTGADLSASVPDGDHLAMVLEFSLAPSSYATMVYRELMKSSSSKKTQIDRTAQFLDREKE